MASLSEKTLFFSSHGLCHLEGIEPGQQQAFRISIIFLRGLLNIKAAGQCGKIGQTLVAHTSSPSKSVLPMLGPAAARIRI